MSKCSVKLRYVSFPLKKFIVISKTKSEYAVKTRHVVTAPIVVGMLRLPSKVRETRYAYMSRSRKFS